MRRTSLMVAAAAALALVAAACGSDSGATTYEATRPGSDDVRTVPPATDEPVETTDPEPTVVLPTLPGATTTDGTDTTLAPSGEIVVRDQWFEDDGFGGYNWGVVYENTSTTSYEYVDVEATFLDGSGQVMATSDTTVYLATPGVGAVAYYTYDLDQAPDSVQVTMSGGDVSDYTPAGTVTAGQLTADDSASTVTGILTSTLPADVLGATVTAVWRDDAGAITSMSGDYVDAIQANGETWFSIYTGTGSAGTPAEVYVELSTPFESTPPAAELTLRESWYVDAGDGGINWGAIVDNGGSAVWSGPTVVAKFFDADNRLVTADSAYASDVRPGANAVSSSLYALPATPVRMEVVISDGGYQEDSPTEGTLTIDQVSVTTDGSSSTITGQVSSTFTEDQTFVELVMVWRDASNAVVYSTSTYTDEIPAGGSAPFEATVYGESNLPTTAPTEIYWST